MSTQLLCSATWALLMAGTAHALTPATLLNAASSEPRAFGYQVGDVVSRTVSVHVPDGLLLDDSSVPQPGARGRALELRSVAMRSHAEPGGRRVELSLTYQVFLAPVQVRTLETPTFTLRFQGQPRAQEVRVEAWPVTVSPLLPLDASPRRGLGDLRPDTPPPLIDTTAARNRMAAYAAVGLLLLGYLVYVYFGLPWWARGHRPFTLAWRALRSSKAASADVQRRDAFARLHEALNRTAGEVVFEQGIDRFVSAHPRFAPLRADLVSFFEQSRRQFFAADEQGAPDTRWLLGLCRRCRDAERGAA